jgi:hypothetical protein
MNMHKTQHKATSVINMVKLQNLSLLKTTVNTWDMSMKWPFIIQSTKGQRRGKMTLSLVESNYTEHLYHWTSQLSGEHSCFLFNRIHAQISVQRPALQTEDFVVFLSSPSANARRVTQVRLQLFLFTSLQMHHSLIIISFRASLLTALWNK